MTSGARLLANIAFIGVVDGLLVLACLLAWIKGGPAERTGATLYFASALVGVALALVGRTQLPIVPELFFDGLVAVGFLVLAIRYNSLWLGAAMMLKGGQLALHAMHLTDPSDIHIGAANVYVLALDAISVSISLTILLGTLYNMRARRRRSMPEPIALAH